MLGLLVPGLNMGGGAPVAAPAPKRLYVAGRVLALAIRGSVGTTLHLRGGYDVAIRTDLVVYRGEDASIVCTVAGQNINGWAVSFKLALTPGSAALVTKTVGGGIALTTPASGVLTVTLSSGDTSLAPGTYWYSIARTDSGQKTVLSWGRIEVRANTTVGGG